MSHVTMEEKELLDRLKNRKVKKEDKVMMDLIRDELISEI